MTQLGTEPRGVSTAPSRRRSRGGGVGRGFVRRRICCAIMRHPQCSAVAGRCSACQTLIAGRGELRPCRAPRPRSPRGRGSGTVMISCTRPSLHDHDAVGEQHRLVEIVGDEQDGLAGAGVDVEQLGLHGLARLRVERAERLVHQQHLRVDGERARDADALLHAAGELMRAAVRRIAAGRPARDSARRCRAAALPRMPFISRPNITFCSAVSHGSSSACWNTMPRSWPQPLTSRPSTVTLPPDAVSSPMAMRNAVVLPQPLGPISATISPSRTAKLTRSSAWTVCTLPSIAQQ